MTKLSAFLAIWFIVSIPAGLLFGKLIAAGNRMGADTIACPEKECDNFSKSQIQGDGSLKDAA